MIQKNKSLKSIFQKIVSLTLLLIVAFLWIPFAMSQDKFCQNLLSEVSSTERELFFERLDQYFQLEKEKRWSELFELSIDLPTKGEKHRRTFVEIRNEGVSPDYSVDFVPTFGRIVNMFQDSRIWLVEGCGNLQKGAKTLRIRYGMNAMLHKGTWYFDNVAPLTEGVGGEQVRCS